MSHSKRYDEVMHRLRGVMELYSNELAHDRVKQAFLSLIKRSDAIQCARPGLSKGEVEQPTEMVMKCLCCDDGNELRIPLHVGQALSGYHIVIDYYDVFNFLEMYSEDIFSQAMWAGRNAQCVADVDQMWIGMALRYRYCASHERYYFPVSAVLALREVVRRLSSPPGCCDAVVSGALETLVMLEEE